MLMWLKTKKHRPNEMFGPLLLGRREEPNRELDSMIVVYIVINLVENTRRVGARKHEMTTK